MLKSQKERGSQVTKVLFIPGIKGTQLFQGNHKRWYPSNPKDIEALHFENPLTPREPVGRVTIPSMLQNIDIYEGLIKHFQGKNISFNVFPYDWRQSIYTHLNNLNTLIDSIGGPVTIIAHSMGGMIAKAYLLNYGESKVEKLISIGTPWLGAPDAFKALVFGEPLISENDITYHALNLSRDKTAKSLARSFPSTYELLPSLAYYNEPGGKFYKSWYGKSASWQQIETKVKFPGLPPMYQDYSTRVHLDMLKPITIPNFALIGYGFATLKAVPERTKNRLDKSFANFWNGDGVVPFISSKPPHQSQEFYLKGEHKELASMPETLNWLDWVLSGATGQFSSGITRTMPSKKLNKVVMARILCPVGFTLRDNEGFSISGDLDPEAIDLDKLKKDRETYIQSVGDAKYVFFNETETQEKENYSLEIDTYENGLANISLVNFEEGVEDEITNFKSVPVDEGTVLKLSLSEAPADTQLEVHRSDSESAIISKRTIRADIFNDDDEISENTQPVEKPFKIKVSAAENVKRRRIPVFSGNVKLEVTYDDSKVFELFWVRNNGIAHEYVGPVEIPSEEGKNLLTVYARDYEGNSYEAESYEYTVEFNPVVSKPVIEFDPEYGFGVSLDHLDTSVGVKEMQFRLKKFNDEYTQWYNVRPRNITSFSIRSIFGIGPGEAELEFKSIDSFDREEPPRSLKLSIGNIRELVWGEQVAAVTPLSIWNTILPDTRFGSAKVSILVKNKNIELDYDKVISDNAKEVTFVSSSVELRLRFMEQYTLYWDGPPTEVISKGMPYEFSFQLLTDHKLPITESEPVVRYYPLSPQGKTVGGGITVDLEEQDGKFSGSFIIDEDYNGNKIRLKVTDNKHKSPALRETTLIIQN